MAVVNYQDWEKHTTKRNLCLEPSCVPIRLELRFCPVGLRCGGFGSVGTWSEERESIGAKASFEKDFTSPLFCSRPGDPAPKAMPVDDT